VTYSEEYETQRTSFRLVLLSFINRAYLWVLTRISAKATTGPFWRLCGRFLFLEMHARQWRGPLSAKPYIQFERYFAQSPEHLERFQNFVAGNGILPDLLSANWFEYLPIKDRVPVTSLFRRIYKGENVWLSYRNRPAIVDRLKTLENVDQDSLPGSVFIVPVRSVRGLMGAWLKVSKFFSAIGTAIENSFKTAFRGIDSLFSAITLLILGVPVMLLSIFGFASPALQAWATRSKINQLAGLRPNSKKIGGLLSRYETLYAGNTAQAQKMAEVLKKPAFRSFLTEDRLDNLKFNDRVLVTSLMRRCAAEDPQFAGLLNTVSLNEAVTVKSQRHVAQLNEPGKQQRAEWKIFKKLNSGQKQKAAQLKAAAPAPAAKPARVRPAPTSESVLLKQGWFSPLQKPDMEFATALRERAYNDAAAFADNADSFKALSPQMMTKAAAVMALLQKPFTHNAAYAEVDNSLLIPATIRNRANKEQAQTALSEALPHLYPTYEGDAARSPIACWTALQDALGDDTEFSYAAEVLTASYSSTAFNRITDRSVSFDTFMVTRLEEILDKIRLWVDWDDCPTSALTAYAHAAASIGDRASFDFFIVTLDGRTGIPPRFIINLRDSFFNTGIHHLDAVLSPATAATQDSQLITLDKGKKYLCLVEMGARVQALRQVEGVSNKLLCGPVAPTDAVKFPLEATLVQAEDFIPMYSSEDMEIGKEIDRLTEHYLDEARKTLKTSGISELYEDAIEVTHATMFFALYRDAVSARICEKLIKTASDYDGVILLTKTGQILGNMIAPAIEAVGRENVYLSLGSHRAAEFFGALTTMRAAAKPSKAKKPIAKTEDSNSAAWMSGMGGWISDSMNFHGRAMQNVKPGPYSIMTLEHINGYYDSYQALIREGLPHSNVELFTSAANVQLNDHITEGGFAPYEGEHSLQHCVLRPRAPDARPWITPFVQTLRGSFESFKSPYLPHYHDMILGRAQAVFAQRLPQIMDAISYFRARFAEGLPDYIFTGPNQHMISRAAAYCGKAAGVPVYDFLILANTNHPRYRPIIANYAYLYDPWYKEIYQSFFGMKEDQLRTAGPLFEYSERLKQAPNADYAAPRGKTHIVFFSQSANFDNSKIMLESICQATKDRKDIYITVKLHPHESPANVERYTQIAADNGIKGNIYVFHKGDAVALLNQADLVVQSFSNIGLDALLLKKPVITFKPKTTLKARIFLYEKDIGYVVSTKRTLTNKIKKFLKDPKDRKAMQNIADKFAAENDHFLRGQNAARVMTSVQEDVIRYKTARES